MDLLACLLQHLTQPVLIGVAEVGAQEAGLGSMGLESLDHPIGG
jgi:hypothetical protein